MKSLSLLVGLLFCGFSGTVFPGEPAKKNSFVPMIDGEWWDIASNPDLGKFGKQGQEPVDFGIWQAADGTWQVWSCIRNVNSGGHERLFYRWEGKNLTDTHWTPMGIAMQPDPELGESEGGLQAPFVIEEKDTYYMFYGDWDRICLAKSADGKIFERVLNKRGQPDLFRGPYQNTRDAMVLKSNGLFFCYYTGHTSTPPPGQDSCAVFCRISTDLYQWSDPLVVCSGGSPSKGIAWYGADSECPFVVNYNQSFYLFRNQLYGPGGLNTQYVSDNPLYFGTGDDNSHLIGQLNVSAPEIIEYNGEYYIAALKPNLDGIRVAKLKWKMNGTNSPSKAYHINSRTGNDNHPGTWYERELSSLYDLSKLPAYSNDTVFQLSSYDPTGGNDDGFSGKYSYIRKENDGWVVADIQGAGVINRLWTPTPSTDTLKFYFDGEKQPRIALPFIDLFSGKVYPFTAPLCGNEIGGYYCYLPIPFARSLKIVYQGEGLKFHQIQYRKLSGNQLVKSFSFDYFNRNRNVFQPLISVWESRLPVMYDSGIHMRKLNFSLASGEEKSLLELHSGGRITGIEINAGNDLQNADGKLTLTARWDNEPQLALNLPFHKFFGYAFGQPAMHSRWIGANRDKYYCYFPMPFDSSAILSLKYEDEQGKELMISGTIYYSENQRDKDKEGKFYTQSRREYLPEKGKPYRIAAIEGRGHYVGTILTAQGLEEGMTLFWEGDDCSIIDGEMRMHGTGSEDYFNGGWYAVADRWDKGVSLPLHGSLLYDLKRGRTGGYRLFLSDKINFHSSYQLTMEHGPEKNEVAVDYSSVGLFYSDRPQFENTCVAEVKNEIRRRDILTPQDFLLKLYWFTTADFWENTLTLSSRQSDGWMANIDFEAVSMAQIDLTGLDNGKYKLHVVYGGKKDGNPFSIWQRTRPVFDWLETNFPDETITAYAGEIEISDQIKTITIRKKKTDDTSVEIHSFIFEKINK
jgi:hypothetical protein